jgi:hypothetical protein
VRHVFIVQFQILTRDIPLHVVVTAGALSSSYATYNRPFFCKKKPEMVGLTRLHLNLLLLTLNLRYHKTTLSGRFVPRLRQQFYNVLIQILEMPENSANNAVHAQSLM